MASTVEICNAALIKVGASTVISLEDGAKAAQLCAARWPAVRDATLRAHPWNCAIRRVRLAPLLEPPAFGFARQFQLPADCLRVLDVGEAAEGHRCEGGRLLTDAEAVQLTYVRRVEDSEAFDPLLAETIAARLAAELAYPLANSTTLAEALWRAYDSRLREARSADAQGSGSFGAAESWLAGRP